jgi:hypothetical protein
VSFYPDSNLTLPQVVVAACEKFPGKFDVAAKMIKEASVCRLNKILHFYFLLSTNYAFKTTAAFIRHHSIDTKRLKL